MADKTMIRPAQVADIPQQKKIWQLCFGDQKADIDYYYDQYYQSKQTLVIETAGQIGAMLTMIPICGVMPDGSALPATMLYAIATHPEHQKKGWASKLIEHANQISRQKQQSFTILVPAGLSLFNYYSKQGYQRGFFVRETLLNQAQMAAFCGRGNQQDSVVMAAVSIRDYNQRRRRCLKGTFYIDFADNELGYQRSLSRRSGADIYGLDIQGEQGCAIIEKTNEGKVIIKELLIADECLVSALQMIASKFQASKYLIRTPAAAGKVLGGEVRAFGMIRINQMTWDLFDKQQPGYGYLGVAFD